MSFEPELILQALEAEEVDYIIVGGMAAVIHGAPVSTLDLDLCYQRGSANYKKLSKALEPFRPRLRGAEEGLPFQLDSATLHRGSNFTLETSAGALDLLGRLTGVGGYGELQNSAEVIEVFGCKIKVISLADLIRAKEAAGRDKDLMMLPILKETLRLQREGSSSNVQLITVLGVKAEEACYELGGSSCGLAG